VDYLSVIYKGKPTNVIVSIAKDGFLKVWDAETRLCISVISTQTTEAVSMTYNLEKSLIYVGTNKEDLLMVKINEHSDKDLCEVVGVFKRKNYTRCSQISIEYNKLYVLSN
jgi:WD40 repeat protein